MSGTGDIMGKVKVVLWIAGALALIIGVLVVLTKFGTGWAALLSMFGAGGAGWVRKADKKARKAHEKVVEEGADAVADDNLDMLRGHRDGDGG